MPNPRLHTTQKVSEVGLPKGKYFCWKILSKTAQSRLWKPSLDRKRNFLFIIEETFRKKFWDKGLIYIYIYISEDSHWGDILKNAWLKTVYSPEIGDRKSIFNISYSFVPDGLVAKRTSPFLYPMRLHKIQDLLRQMMNESSSQKRKDD